VPGAIITTFSYGLRTIFDGRGLVATASPPLRCPADDGEEAPDTVTQFSEKELSKQRLQCTVTSHWNDLAKTARCGM
jgi:hypothetical protein